MTMTSEQYLLLQKGTTSFCMLARIQASADKGGGVLRVALHSRHVVFENELYSAVPVEVSEFQSTAGTEIDNATFQTVLGSLLNRLSLKAGIWQGAVVELTVVDYLNLGAGYIQRQHGRLGQAEIIGQEARIEFRGLTQMLAQEIGERTSRLCRYQLGDQRCKVNLANFTFSGTVTAVTSKQKFSISISKPDTYFYRGRITFSSGLNNGLSMETTQNTGTLLTLFQPMFRTIAIGDAFFIVAGDPKTLQICHSRFNNAINFGGESEIPERERLFRYP